MSVGRNRRAYYGIAQNFLVSRRGAQRSSAIKSATWTVATPA